MDIAIQFEKYNLGEDRYLFKPVSVVRGTYDETAKCFITDSGIYCYLINGYEPDADYYFYAPTTIDELKNLYGDDYTEEELIYEYFSAAMENCYIGIYGIDDSDCKIDIVQISYSNLEESIIKLKVANQLKAIKVPTLNKDESKDAQTKNTKLKLDKEKSKGITLSELRKEVLSKIVGQDRAVNDITRTIIVNNNSKNPRHKSHIMIAGPTGTGKTEIVNIISNYLGVPYFKADATAYTKEGYVGKSVYSMLLGLIEAADGDIEKAQHGILIIDEIDKKFSDDDQNDVSGRTVLNSLLKIMDREIVEVEVGHNQSILFDTSNLTIICSGAFTDLFENKKKELGKNTIGFSEDTYQNKEVEITKEDIRKYGNVSEFMGRIGISTYTNEFSIENLINILKKSKISPLVEEREFFKDLGITVTFTSGYIEEVAKMCHKQKEGARGLKNIVKDSLKYAYDEVLTNNKVKTLRLTKETAHDATKYHSN